MEPLEPCTQQIFTVGGRNRFLAWLKTRKFLLLATTFDVNVVRSKVANRDKNCTVYVRKDKFCLFQSIRIDFVIMCLIVFAFSG